MGKGPCWQIKFSKRENQTCSRMWTRSEPQCTHTQNSEENSPSPHPNKVSGGGGW